MKYSILHDKLKLLEIKWQGRLSGRVPANPVPSMANGEIQFFSVESFDRNQDLDLPVVVGVGINYSQGIPAKPGSYAVPHLFTHTGSWVEDYAPGMRAATDATLDAYCFAQRTWVTNNYASELDLWPASHRPPLNYKYHLVATNFNPFISKKRWLGHSRIDRDLLRSAWPTTDYLDDLHHLLEHADPLWIGHGREAVWGDFRAWQRKLGVGRWLLTHNLSPLTISMVRPFWMKP